MMLYHFLYHIYVSFLTFSLYYDINSFDFFEVKLLNSHIFMSYVDART